MNIKFLSSGGYQLWPCAEGAGETTTLPVCPPEFVTDLQGNIKLEAMPIIPAPNLDAGDIRPKMTTREV